MCVLVWPKPEASPPALPLGPGNFAGMASNAGGSDDFAGLRAYQSGDSLRHIAWKVAAGGGPLMTKHFSGVQAGEVSAIISSSLMRITRLHSSDAEDCASQCRA